MAMTLCLAVSAPELKSVQAVAYMDSGMPSPKSVGFALRLPERACAADVAEGFALEQMLIVLGRYLAIHSTFSEQEAIDRVAIGYREAKKEGI